MVAATGIPSEDINKRDIRLGGGPSTMAYF